MFCYAVGSCACEMRIVNVNTRGRHLRQWRSSISGQLWHRGNAYRLPSMNRLYLLALLKSVGGLNRYLKTADVK